MSKTENMKVKFFEPECNFIHKQAGDWIDLRSAVDIEFKAPYVDENGRLVFDSGLIPLGVAMELPEGYEAVVAPRSSTFKKFGIMMTNSIGVIDNGYRGDNDQWHFPYIAMKTGKINKGDRICQFRIQKSYNTEVSLMVEVVDKLGNDDRGGFGSSGTK